MTAPLCPRPTAIPARPPRQAQAACRPRPPGPGAGLGRALAIAATLALAWPAQAAPLACLIEPSQVVDVGSPVVGVLASVTVERGDLVRRGDTVATLRSDVERANLSAAETRAQVQAEVRASQAAADLARARLVRAQDLRAQNFISQVALEQAQSEADVALRRVEVAREQQRVARQDSQTARTQLAQRTIAATLDGVVTARYMNPGERIDDKPVLRIARLDPLRVELVLPLADLGKLKAGDRLAIKPDYPGAPGAQATVERIDPVVDAASRTWRARLALPNPGHRILAGVRCLAEVPGATPAPVPGASPAVLSPATPAPARQAPLAPPPQRPAPAPTRS